MSVADSIILTDCTDDEVPAEHVFINGHVGRFRRVLVKHGNGIEFQAPRKRCKGERRPIGARPLKGLRRTLIRRFDLCNSS